MPNKKSTNGSRQEAKGAMKNAGAGKEQKPARRSVAASGKKSEKGSEKGRKTTR